MAAAKIVAVCRLQASARSGRTLSDTPACSANSATIGMCSGTMVIAVTSELYSCAQKRAPPPSPPRLGRQGGSAGPPRQARFFLPHRELARCTFDPSLTRAPSAATRSSGPPRFSNASSAGIASRSPSSPAAWAAAMRS